MGADEMFGGYSRHRRSFSQTGWRGLGEELFREIREISGRNLGRDNRVVADHARQPRTPFLDENVLQFVDSLPPWHRYEFLWTGFWHSKWYMIIRIEDVLGKVSLKRNHWTARYMHFSVLCHLQVTYSKVKFILVHPQFLCTSGNSTYGLGQIYGGPSII